jgi:hypothetical protein
MSAHHGPSGLANGGVVLWIGLSRIVAVRFDLHASLLICVHFRSNFLRSTAIGIAIRLTRFGAGRPRRGYIGAREAGSANRVGVEA